MIFPEPIWFHYSIYKSFVICDKMHADETTTQRCGGRGGATDAGARRGRRGVHGSDMSVWFRGVAVARRGATVASHPPRLDACRLRLRRSGGPIPLGHSNMHRPPANRKHFTTDQNYYYCVLYQ